MNRKTVPVSSVPSALVDRLETLTLKVAKTVKGLASGKVDRSLLCRLAIEDLVERYESDPASLANRLGFRVG